ncbi:peptidyl-prolyl cis-trans isomerase [Theileria orientalis strain Shintoku]|uniref:Peptidyl-prolyl cis-trans isomerase n=1 Tax=Theileria orientalis strain Shintoku TaxID=869250 RepID=J4DPT0_THEOR|nr:peptidyl-prolyl cis-trans isomerase [Theileria orientalis strain Shintoku]PVC51807.1 peptidyl-prolyl cis-trans isomerase [Theileria orientalis]BAM41239.1 peptidyl-prolyl cis-trans isomerase [Theileria orientalis strain Shintoku]|eukprot:XP_009691540.1 peptidyl-prolyl cis-trans isomerase [Theileria orientalis strain Shintoku]
MSVTLHTNFGDLKIELFCKDTPKTCKNFLALCASDYYNNTKFHRLAPYLLVQTSFCCKSIITYFLLRNIKGFLIQGGDPTGTGKGGESIYGEPFEDEFVSHLKHDKRGMVSMANPGQSNSNASQFFITYSKQMHLNNQYTVFGRLISGLDTLEKLENVPVGKKNRPLTDIIIESITIHTNPIADLES